VNQTRRPNRLGAPGINDESSFAKGMLSMADNKENAVPPVERGPSQLEKGLEIAKRVAIVIGVLISAVLGAVASGALTLPAGVLGVLNAILGLLAAAGLASNGLHKAPPPPRIGPPE